MKQETKERIRRAVESNRVVNVNNEIQRAIKSEILCIQAKDIVINRLVRALEKVTLPIKIETLSQTEENHFPIKNLIIVWPIAGIVIAFLARYSLMTAILFSALCAIVTLFLYRKNAMGETNTQTLQISTNADDIAYDIQNVVLNLREAIIEASPDLNTETSQVQRLYDVYPNIVRWLHGKYIDSVELGMENQARMQKSINNLLEQCNYEIVDFDKNNEAFFEINHSSHVKDTTQLEPAIIDSSTGKVVVKGSVLLP